MSVSVPLIPNKCIRCHSNESPIVYLPNCSHSWCEDCLIFNYSIHANKNESFLCSPNDKTKKCLVEITIQVMNQLKLSSKFDETLNNLFWKKYRTEKCPTCSYHCVRMNNKDQRVSCPKCKKDFCFFLWSFVDCRW